MTPTMVLLASLSAAGLPSLAEVVRDVQEARRQLVAGEYDRLERSISERQQAFEKDPAYEDPAWSLLHAPAAVNDPAAEVLLTKWIEARPRSWVALAARGVYYHSTGWRKRGGARISETPQQNIESMLELHRKATTDCLAALDIKPAVTSCHAALIAIASANGDTAQAKMRLMRGEQAAPRSFVIPVVYLMNALAPRWGGSLEAMSAFAAEAVKRSDLNPRMRTIPGYVLASRARDAESQKDPETAVELYAEAIRMGEEPPFHADRGVAYSALGDRRRALEEFDRAIQLGPYGWWGGGVNLIGTLERRATALWSTGRPRESLDVWEMITVLDPANERAPMMRDLLRRLPGVKPSN